MIRSFVEKYFSFVAIYSGLMAENQTLHKPIFVFTKASALLYRNQDVVLSWFLRRHNNCCL